MAAFKPTSAAELCEFEELASLTHTAPKKVTEIPRWKRKQAEAAEKQKNASLSGGGGVTARNPNTPSKKSKTTPSKAKNPTPSKAAAASSSAGSGAVDRFVPTRSRMDMAHANFSLSQGAENAGARGSGGEAGSGASAYHERLDKALGGAAGSGGGSGGGNGSDGRIDASGANWGAATDGSGGGGRDGKGFRILSFRDKAPVAEDHFGSCNDVLYSGNRNATGPRKPFKSAKTLRHIPSAPTRILDAPGLLDDYYLNLVAWSARNIIAVALGPAVHLCDAKSGSIDELMALEDESDYVCSLKFIPGGTHLAVGTATANTQLWDTDGMRQVRSMNGHSDRVSCLAWKDHVLSSGSKDTTIVHHDVRVRDHAVATLAGHEQEVCGLAWSPEGHALASGGNDNKLMIWDASSASSTTGANSGLRNVVKPRFKIGEHCAAVKALAWSPHERNLIASGGGTADRCIKFFNSQTGSMLNSIDTGSQVCSLLWNPHEKEILSSHGFSRNEINLWRYPSMAKVKELTGHTARVLHMAASPDGSSVVSAGADETLRFWDIFGGPPEKKKSSAFAGSGLNAMSSIR